MFTMSRRTPSRRRPRRPAPPLAVQRLEPRHACAGLVTAVLQGSVLTLTGDAASNGLDIQTVNGMLRVAGLNPGAGPTAIAFQGRQLGRLDVAGVLDLRVNLGEGFDAVLMGRRGGAGLAPTAVRSVTVDLGAGSGVFGADGVEVGGGMTIVTGSSTDAVRILATRVAGPLSIQTNDGADSIDVTGNVVVAGNATIDAGSGNDRISVYDQVSVAGTLDVFGRPDDDAVLVSRGVVVTGPLNVDLGWGSDFLEISRMVGTRSSLSILGRSGDDVVVMERDVAALGPLAFDMGIDDDAVLFSDRVSTAGACTVQLGAGDSDVVQVGRQRAILLEDGRELTSMALTVGGNASFLKAGGLVFLGCVGPLANGQARFQVGGALRVEGGGGGEMSLCARVGGSMHVVMTGASGNSLHLHGSAIAGGLSVTAGEGEDAVTITETGIGGDLTVSTAGENDGVALWHVSVAGRVSVALGLGADRLTVTALVAAAATLDGQGGGGDEVTLVNQRLAPVLAGFERVTRS